MIKILAVETNQAIWEKWARELGIHYSIVGADNLHGAWLKFTTHQDIAAIVMTACVPPTGISQKPQEPNSDILIQRIRAEGFKGDIVATSRLLKYRGNMIKAGANRECAKDEVPQLLMSIFNP